MCVVLRKGKEVYIFSSEFLLSQTPPPLFAREFKKDKSLPVPFLLFFLKSLYVEYVSEGKTLGLNWQKWQIKIILFYIQWS